MRAEIVRASLKGPETGNLTLASGAGMGLKRQ